MGPPLEQRYTRVFHPNEPSTKHDGGFPSEDTSGCLTGLRCISSALARVTFRPVVEDEEQKYELVAGEELSAAKEEMPTSREAVPKDIDFKNSSKSLPYAITVTLIALIAFISGVFCSLVPMYLDSPSHSHRNTHEFEAQLAKQTDTTKTLDLVVSRYDEPATLLAENLAPLLAVPGFHNLTTRITIYNTGSLEDSQFNSTFYTNLLLLLLPKEPQVTIPSRENVGREGAAYLHHITTNWDQLADHTLFMQAGVEDMDHATWLIQNYFVPRTGFLSLHSSMGSCARCTPCSDGHDWSESSSIIEEIYDRAHNSYGNTTECISTKSLTLTYKGQFIVSRGRLHAPGRKELFADLLDWLINPKSRMHTDEYLTQPGELRGADSVNAPYFGYTLERLWGVVMGCDVTEFLPETCFGLWAAGLESGLRIGGVESGFGQCLDLDHGHEGI